MSTLFASDAKALVNEQGQKVIIPEIYTSIADQAFRELQLTSVEIPGSISTIGQYAFYANQLENIVIADGVQSIGYLTFGSNQLTSVDVPDSVTTISDYAFYENQLTSIEIPNSVTSLGGGAFSFNQLSSVDIPESLSSIFPQVFFGNQLTNIAIPNGVSEIGDRAFGNNQLTSVDIPESVRMIGAAAFFENALTSIVLPTNLIEIKQNAFRNNQLTIVEIPNSVVEIGNNAFLGNPLERISISEDASFDLSVYEDAGVEIIFRNINAPTDLAISTTDLDSTYILGGGGVVAWFNTTDADTNDTFTYTLIEGEGDTDNGEFSIEGDELTIKTSPDYETKDSYSIRVRTTDSEGLGFEKVFELMVFYPDETLLTRDNANTLVNDQGIDVIIPDRYEAIDENAFERKQLTSVVIPESIASIGSYAFYVNELTRADIPDSVTAIGNNAFAFNRLTSIEIPEAITTIEDSSFRYNDLESIIIPEQVTSIGKLAFNNNQLTSVSFGDNLSLIDDYAFRANELESLILPNSIRLIGEYAFSANNLSSVKIPDGVMEIGREAFWDNQLESIIIPNSVQLIGIGAFAENQLADVEISDSISVISGYTFRGNQLTSVEIPDGVTEIGPGSFTRNQLADVEIANSVISIGSYAFSQNQLTDIYIPDSVNTIGEFAFQYNPLESISVSGDVSFDFSYYEQSGTEIIIRNLYVPPTDILLSASSFGEDLIKGSIVASFNTVDDDTNDRFTYSLVNGDGDIDNSIFIIEGNQLKIQTSPDYETQDSYSIRVKTVDKAGNAFEKALTIGVNNIEERNLTSNDAQALIDEQGFEIVIPNIFNSIDRTAFYEKELISAEIPKSVTDIGDGAFNSNKLTDIKIGDRVTLIRSGAFAYNELTTVEIPNSVTVIFSTAFSNNKLSDVKIGEQTIIIGGDAFANNQLTNIIIPNNVDSIREGAFSDNQIVDLEIGSKVTEIRKNAFSNNQLTSVVIPDSVELIGDSAFTGNQLSSVKIGDGVISIGNWAFEDDNNSNTLTDLEIGDSVQRIGIDAFAFNSLTSVDLPDGVNTIESGAFMANQLTSIDIPDSVTYLGGSAFFANQLKNVIISDGLTIIPWQAFALNQLSSVDLPDNIIEIGAHAFAGNDLLNLEIPDGVSSIGDKAFFNNQLSSVDLPDNIIEIGAHAFAGNNLLNLDIPDGVVSIGEKAFQDNQLSSVVIPDGSSGNNFFRFRTSIGNYAFANNQITSIDIPDSVTSIGNGAFANNQLSSVRIPDVFLNRIGSKAFINNQLTNVDIPDSIGEIGSKAFAGNQITSVVIPDSVYLLAEDAFADNPLENISLPGRMVQASLIDASLYEDAGVEVIVRDLPTDLSITSITIPEIIDANSGDSHTYLYVATLRTTDPDSGDSHTYSLVSGTGDIDNNAFTIDGDQLFINEFPDYETQSTYSIRLQTKDSLGLALEKQFTLYVGDFNENPTDLFLDRAITDRTFYENMDADSVVARLNTVDPDLNDTFTYSLIAGSGDTDNSAFSIDADKLIINESPNYEAQSTYSIRLQTKDSGLTPFSENLTFEKVFTLDLSDRNENPTDLSISASTFDENITADSVVATFSSTDPDDGDTFFTYSLISGSGDTDNSIFIIEGDQLKITASPDHETQESYSIRVQTEDPGGLTFEKAFTFLVNDLNENPTDLSISASTFDENITADSVVATFSTTDQDDGDTFTYSLIPGSGVIGTFSYQWLADGTPITGATASTFELTQDQVGKAITVVASYTDGGGTVESLSSAATNAVTNSNDSPTGTLSITGTATQGQTLTADVSAIADLDGLGTFSYQWLADGTPITGATASTFKLIQDQVGKAITVVASYTDGGGTVESLSSAATNTVTNSNDAPVINPGGSDLTGEVTEDGVDDQGNVTPGNSTALGALTADDVDGATQTWSIQGTPSTTYGTFELESNGDWKFTLDNSLPATQALQQDEEVVESFIVRATDEFGAFVDQEIAITIRGANDDQSSSAIMLSDITNNSGGFVINGEADGDSSGYAVSSAGDVNGDGFSDLIIGAPDAVTNSNDSPTGTVSITGTATQGQTLTADVSAITDLDGLDNTAFTIDGDKLIINESPNYKAQSTYSIRLQTKDSGGLTLKKQFTFQVNASPTGTLSITGTATQGQTLTADVSAIADLDGLGTFSYQWLADGTPITGATASTFKLIQDQVGKAITVVASYTDGGGTVESLSSAATNTVTNSNDAPVINPGGSDLTGEVTEDGVDDQGNVTPGNSTALGALTADDVDGATQTWSIQGTPSTTYGTFELESNGDWKFTLDNSLPATQALQQDEEVVEIVTVRATDEFGAFTDQEIAITIRGANDDQSDSNDSPPEPDSPVLTVNPEESDNGGPVVINPESIPDDETLVISSSDLPEDTQQIFELNGGVDSTVSFSIDFQKIDESSTLINTNQSTEGGGSIASNAPQDLILSLDGVYFNSGAGNDSIIGTQFKDFLRGGAGDDLIDAGGGNDVVRAGAGSDQITLGSGNDTLYLTADQLDGATDVLTDFNSAEDSIAFAENLTVSLAGNIATFTTEIGGVERSTQLIFSGFNTLSDEWFSLG